MFAYFSNKLVCKKHAMQVVFDYEGAEASFCFIIARQCSSAHHSTFNSSDDRVVRASASGAVDSGLIPSRVIPVTLKLAFTAFLLDVQHYRDSVENKTVSLLAPLRRALGGIPPSW